MKKSQVYTEYFNIGTGFELEPNQNSDRLKYTSENGTLFFAEYIAEQHARNQVDTIDFRAIDQLLPRLEDNNMSNLYHRDLNSKIEAAEGNWKNVNGNSKDNMEALSVLMKVRGDTSRLSGMISKIVEDKFKLTNNKIESAILHPASIFKIFYTAKSFGIAAIFFPVFILNMLFDLITKPAQKTSSRLLNIMFFQGNKERILSRVLFPVYLFVLRLKYKDPDPIQRMREIYFRDTKHPLRNLEVIS